MSTYTDLHNRVKENITVDYNSRITPQEVHLLNENNEFWGTLKGHVSAENINIDGGTLKNVKLENIELCGSVILPDNVDISRAAADIKQLSDDLLSFKKDNSDKHTTYEQDISNIKVDLGKHFIKINELSTDIKDLKATKLDIDSAQQNMAIMSALIVDQIEDLSDEIFNNVEELSDEIFKTVENISSSFNVVDTYLSDEIDTLTLKFGGEVQDRVNEDNKIKQIIKEKSIESIQRDNIISSELTAYKLENEKNIDQLTENIVEKIEHDKHHTITNQINGSLLTDNYPFSCKDFSVNIYKTYIKEGIVEYNDPSGVTYPIGEITKLDNGYKFKTFNEINCDAILSAINSNYEYLFTNGIMTVNSGRVNGYYDLTLDFEAKTITLRPTIPTYHAINFGSQMVGKVYDAYIEGDNIISGRMFITTDDTGLSSFKQFNNVPFNTTNLSVSDLYTSERFEYFGENRLRFTKNISFANYVPVNNANDGTEFARIYDTNNNEDLTGDIAVSLTYLEPEERIVGILNEDNNYRTIVKANQLRGDKLFDLTLSATIENNTAIFDVIEVSEMYKYAFSGINNNGEMIEAGYVVPVQYNKTLLENKDFEKLSVNIQNAINIESFKQTYVLDKIDASLWTCEVIDDEKENTLNIKFNGEEVRIKITSKDGNVNAYIYKINVNDKVIFNIDDCHRHIYTSNETELKYTEIDPSVGESYNTEISKIPTNDNMQTYTLEINQAENDILKICIPERSTNDISREFSVVINPKSASNKLVELQLTDKHGNKVDYISNRRDKLLVPTNKWTNLQVNEINHNKFFIKDFDGNENAHDIRMLSGSIEKLSNDLSIEVDNLSVNLSTDLSNEISTRIANYEYLSSQISSNDEDIADIYNRIKGGINYKGVIYGKIKDSSGNAVSIEHISNLFVFKQHNFKVNDYVEDTILSNGFMYIVNQFEDLSTKKFTIEGKDIEIGDQIIINCIGVNGKAIKDLTINDVDIIDNEDFDAIHYPEFEELSIKLSTEINTLSDSLSTTTKLSVENLQTQINSNDTDIEYLSGQHDWLSVNLSTDLSNEISSRIKAVQDLSTSLSTDINSLSDRLSIEISSVSSYTTLSIGNLCSEISSNDEDISKLSGKVDFLLSVGHDSVEYKGTIIHNESKIDFNLSTFIMPLVNDKDGFIKRGLLYRLSAEEKQLSDYTRYTTYLGEKDFFIVNKDTTLDTITFNDIDIFRNTETEVSYLSNELQNQIVSNDNDINYLSSEMSANDNDIEYLSVQHDWLSAHLSTDINSLSDRLSIEISSVSSYTTLSIGNLCSEISSNDKNILDISADLISVSNRYSNTFVGKDKTEYTEHISSDNLVLTDIAHPHDKYYMSFESETIVLKPIK